MKGYLLNTTSNWKYSMKRSIGPGAKVPLSELYEQYGIKHDISEGEDFIKWLRDIKLKNNRDWRIVVEEPVNGEIPRVVDKQVVTHQDNSYLVKRQTEVQEIVDLSVRQAREKLPTIKDKKLLKYALQEANKLAGKDSLCKLIRKRITDLT